MTPKGKILIVGLGNLLMGDEGVGVHCVQNWSNAPDWPEDVDWLDGGTGGFHLLHWLDQYTQVIMIDASLDEAPVGSINLIEPRFASDFPKALSTHEIGLKDLVESMLLLQRMPQIFLFTVSVAEIQPMQLELSDPVKNSLPELKQRLKTLALQCINNYKPAD